MPLWQGVNDSLALPSARGLKSRAVMEERIRKAWQAINGLVEVQQCEIAGDYMDLKLEELRLVHEHHERLQDEKEEQRRIREQMRDEEIAQRQLERARQDAEKDEQRYEAALAKARREVEEAAGAKQLKLQNQIADLERRLQEAHDNKQRAIARAQLTRSGHVYVISNIGSFGEHVHRDRTGSARPPRRHRGHAPGGGGGLPKDGSAY